MKSHWLHVQAYASVVVSDLAIENGGHKIFYRPISKKSLTHASEGSVDIVGGDLLGVILNSADYELFTKERLVMGTVNLTFVTKEVEPWSFRSPSRASLNPGSAIRVGDLHFIVIDKRPLLNARTEYDGMKIRLLEFDHEPVSGMTSSQMAYINLDKWGHLTLNGEEVKSKIYELGMTIVDVSQFVGDECQMFGRVTCWRSPEGAHRGSRKLDRDYSGCAGLRVYFKLVEATS